MSFRVESFGKSASWMTACTSAFTIYFFLVMSQACGNFPDKGLNPSAALVGKFFIAEPPGKPQALFLREPKAKTSLNLSQLLYPLLI